MTADSVVKRETAGSSDSERSTSDVMRAIASESQTLVQKQIELARIELLEAVDARIKAAAGAAVAGVAGLFFLYWLSFAGYRALAVVLPTWLAALVTAVVFATVLAVAGLFARASLRQPPLTPEDTKWTLKEDVAWAKQRAKR